MAKFYTLIITLTVLTSLASGLEQSCSNSEMPISLRKVERILPRASPHWVGDAFRVHPVFGNLAFSSRLSPFLMFDYAAPKKFERNNRSPRGVGQHPHRGFETVTLAFQGEVEHKDSTGNGGVIGAGDVQWMTAGRGIIHQEYHSKKFSKAGGTFEMCQLWLNLPRKYKMTAPRYQGISAKEIPTVELPGIDGGGGGTARVIAGTLHGKKGPAMTFTAVQLWDVNIPVEGDTVEIPTDPRHLCVVFVRRGSALIGQDKEHAAGPQSVALMELGGNVVRIQAREKETSLLIMGGEIIDETIVARGPFVMNTQEEIRQANIDYHEGRFGQ